MVPRSEKQERETPLKAALAPAQGRTMGLWKMTRPIVTPSTLHSRVGENKVTLHLLQLEQGGERWCSSREVANLLFHWGGKDLVNKMLKVKRNEMVERLIKEQEQPKGAR